MPSRPVVRSSGAWGQRPCAADVRCSGARVMPRWRSAVAGVWRCGHAPMCVACGPSHRG